MLDNVIPAFTKLKKKRKNQTSVILVQVQSYSDGSCYHLAST